MDTIQLTKAMLKNKHTKHSFLGVFPRDKLPKKVKKKPALIICNTHDSKNPGEHWVAFFIPRKGKPEYFDSIGKKPNQHEFIKFLEKNSERNFSYNPNRLQSTFSTVCGQYCAVYLLYRAKKVSVKNFLKHFTENHLKNDELIQVLFNKNFKSSQVGANSVLCNQTCEPQK